MKKVNLFSLIICSLLVSCHSVPKDEPQKQEEIKRYQPGFEKDPGALRGLESEDKQGTNLIQEQSGTIQ